MSGGRDFKLFLASHKTQIGQNDSKLVTRLLDGQKPSSYKPVDYEQLATLTKIKRSAGEKSRKKVENLLQLNKSRKETSLLQEHKRVWISEWERLLTLEDKTYKELQSLRPPTPNFNNSTPPVEEIYEEITDYEDFLYFDLQEFDKNTIQPVNDLIEDVKIWIQSHENKMLLHMRTPTNENDIQEIINNIKSQQKKIMQQLNENENEIEKEIELILEEIDFHFSDLKLPVIETAIPQQLIDLPCPDDTLRKSCFDEFDLLNEKYNKMLAELEEKYDDVITKVAWNWSEDDHIRFLHIINQYAGVTRNRRKLFMDRITREMPEKLKEEIEEYEQWWFRRKTFQSHLRGICHAWKRDQDDLKLHIEATFAEACDEYEKQKKSKEEHTKQKFYCNYLHDKLNEYREQKDELMKLELANRVHEDQRKEQERNHKQMKEHRRREKDKQKILEYKETKMRLSVLEHEKELARMIVLQEDMSVQRAYNMERIRFREEKYLEKLEKQRQFKEEEDRQQLIKQERLKKLADTVEVHVENDPMRVLEPTQSLMHRTCANNYDEEKDLQQPLFHVYTYNVEQVANDKRLKIENALRRANLHMNEYARELIAKQPPPTCPRKDTLSSIFE